jgi:YcxB-like protein
MPWYSFWIVLGAMFFVIGFAVLGVQKTGRISVAEAPDVLLAAYVAYAFGAGLATLLAFRRLRRIARTAEELAGVPWEVSLADTGMVWKSDISETRLSWRAVKSIEAWREGVLIWVVQRRAFIIPSRIFADSQARQAFIAAVQAHIDRAAQT